MAPQTSAGPATDDFQDGSEYGSGYGSEYGSEYGSVYTHDSDVASDSSSTHLQPIDGIRVDDDGESLHTDDTDVESWYEGDYDLLDFAQEIDEPNVIEARIDEPELHEPVLKKHASDELFGHCQACEELDWGGMIQCSRSFHEEDEGWYHFDCVGLTMAEVSILEEWFCPVCRPRSTFAPVSGRPIVGGKGVALSRASTTQPYRSPLAFTSQSTPASKAQRGTNRTDRRTSKSSRKAGLSSSVVAPSNSGVLESTSERVKMRNRGAASGSDAAKTTHQAPVSTSVGAVLASSSALAPTKKRGATTVSKKQPTASASRVSKKKAPKATASTRHATKREKADNKADKKPWKDPTESQRFADLLREMLASSETEDMRVKGTDHKWEVLSDRLLQRYGYDRTHNSVKNYWQRTGRAYFGIDERLVANPNKMVTSVQDPADRKRRREEKKREAAKANSEDTSFDAYDDTVSDRPQKHTTKRKRDDEDSSDDDEPIITHHRRRRRLAV